MENNEGMQEVRRLSDAIIKYSDELLELLPIGAVQLPIKGTDKWVFAGGLAAIAQALPKDAVPLEPAAEQPTGDLPPLPECDVIGYTCVGNNDAYSPSRLRSYGQECARAAIDKGARQAAPEAPAPTACASTELILPPLPLEDECIIHIYPSDLNRMECSETTATVFSVAVGCPDEVSTPLYTAEQVRQAQRDAYELGQQSQKARIMHLTHERDMARACIDGRTAGTAPEGWKLVPIHPTASMLDAAGLELSMNDESAGAAESDLEYQADAHTAWDAMLAAAPSIATKETP